MQTLTVIPQRRTGCQPPRFNYARPWLRQGIRRAFTPLIDAKAASQLLGVPHTWLLAQARTGNIPHHRLGHYVRFNPDDLQAWLHETRIAPRPPRLRRGTH